MVFNFAKIHPPSEVNQSLTLDPVGFGVTGVPKIRPGDRVSALSSRCLQLMILGSDPRLYLSLYFGPLHPTIEQSCCCYFPVESPPMPLENYVWTLITVRDLEKQGVERDLIIEIEGTCASLAHLGLPRDTVIYHLTVEKDFLPWLAEQVALREDLRPPVCLLNRRPLVEKLARLCHYAFFIRQPHSVLSLVESFLPYLTEMHQLARKARLAALPPLDALSTSFAQTTLLQIERGLFLEASPDDLCVHVQRGIPPNKGAFKAAFAALSLLTETPFASLRCSSVEIASLEVTYLSLARGANGKPIPGTPKVHAIAAYMIDVADTIQEDQYEACIRMEYLPFSLKKLIHADVLFLAEKNDITRALVKIIASLPPGLIHRDLKSANIAFPTDATLKQPLLGQPHLIDFAGAFYDPPPKPLTLAPKVVQDEITPNPLHCYFGSRAYTAPEKIREYYPQYGTNAVPLYAKPASYHEPKDHATRKRLIFLEKQADLYSLGLILQELYLKKNPSETPFPDTLLAPHNWFRPFWRAEQLADTPIYWIVAHLLHPEPSERRLPTDEELAALDSMIRSPSPVEVLPGTVPEQCA